MECPRLQTVEQHDPSHSPLARRDRGPEPTELKLVAQVHYLKVAEMQRRGLIHFHAILRADGPEASGCRAP